MNSTSETHPAAQHNQGLIRDLGLTREAILEAMSAGFVQIKTQFGTMVWVKDVVVLEDLLDSGCSDPIYTLNEILNIALVFKSAPDAVDQFQAIKKLLGSRTMVVPDEPLFVEDYLGALPSAKPQGTSDRSGAPVAAAHPGAARPEIRPPVDTVAPEALNNHDQRRHAVNCI